ncbi:hypothetical protein [Acidovorax sp. sic0104]|uniref:hypothetical protein n=1 Tax=Acidovorax sp. sic0104 TaxID=2854784 RepID=UPI002102A654|nr:hypothetical protein [Acidovorax sp. sic0104]
MAQDIIVGLIVAVAMLYVAWRYMPQGWRQRLGRVHPALVQAPGCGSGDGGGGCSTCSSGGGGCGPAASSPGEAAEKTVAMPRSRH